MNDKWCPLSLAISPLYAHLLQHPVNHSPSSLASSPRLGYAAMAHFLIGGGHVGRIENLQCSRWGTWNQHVIDQGEHSPPTRMSTWPCSLSFNALSKSMFNTSTPHICVEQPGNVRVMGAMEFVRRSRKVPLRRLASQPTSCEAAAAGHLMVEERLCSCRAGLRVDVDGKQLCGHAQALEHACD
jgi:hypothetical protein